MRRLFFLAALTTTIAAIAFGCSSSECDDDLSCAGSDNKDGGKEGGVIPPPPPPPNYDGGVTDSGAPIVKCDRAKPWGALKPLEGLPENSSSGRFTADEKTIYFASNVAGGAGDQDILTMTRDNVNAPFKDRKWLTALNNAETNTQPAISPDGLTLLFVHASLDGRTGGTYLSERATDKDAFRMPSDKLPFTVNGAAVNAGQPFFQGNRHVWFYTSAGGGDVYEGIVSNGRVDGASAVREINSTDWDGYPSVRDDGLELYFASSRGKTTANFATEIWTASRQAADQPFGQPQRAPGIDFGFTGVNYASWISADGCRMYVTHDKGGGSSEMAVTERPPCDFCP